MVASMYVDTRLGEETRYFACRPKDWGMRITDEVRDCVVFVGRILRKGGVEEKSPDRNSFRGRYAVAC